MAFAPKFDKDMKKQLETIAPQYEWKLGWSAEGHRWKVDLAGIPKHANRSIVLVEVELKRDDTVGNVVKIWNWLRCKESKRSPVLLVQAFSKHYWQTKVRQRERAIFVGHRMMEDRKVCVQYEWVQMKYRPKMVPGHRTTEGAGRRALAAQVLGTTVASLIRAAKRDRDA